MFVRATDPLILDHSWPLRDLAVHLAPVALDGGVAGDEDALAERGLGLWHCDLADDSLRWTVGVYDLFGLDRDDPPSRPRSLACYAPESRARMEQLRAHAIAHKCGFTLDIDIVRPDGGNCTVRLITAPLLNGGRVAGLHGVKQFLPRGAARSSRLDPTLFDLL